MCILKYNVHSFKTYRAGRNLTLLEQSHQVSLSSIIILDAYIDLLSAYLIVTIILVSAVRPTELHSRRRILFTSFFILLLSCGYLFG